MANTFSNIANTVGGSGGLENPMTDQGDIIYGGIAGEATALHGPTDAVPRVLKSTGTGVDNILIGTPAGSISTATDLFWCDTHTIRKYNYNTGVVSLVAGQYNVTGSANGTGAEATFSTPNAIATDGTNLYVVDFGNQMIRKIVIETGVVTTLAGSIATSGNVIDDTGAAAGFDQAFDITFDGTDLYVLEIYGSDCIRKVTLGGVVTTVAGIPGSQPYASPEDGGIDGPGATATFNDPEGITNDGTYLYVADSGNNTIRKVVIGGNYTVSTIAGTLGVMGDDDGIGAAATFNFPMTMVYIDGIIYLADASYAVRTLDTTTIQVTTVAGSTTLPGSTDGVGLAARFNYVSGLATPGNGTIYISDYTNHTMRTMTTDTFTVDTLLGTVGQAGSTNGNTIASANPPEWTAITQEVIFNAPMVPFTASGWTYPAINSDATLGLNSENKSLYIPLPGIAEGDTINSMYLLGSTEIDPGQQIDITGNLRKVAVAANGSVSTTIIGTIGPLTITTEGTDGLNSSNTSADVDYTVASNETFYLNLTATTGNPAFLSIYGLIVSITRG